MRRSTRLKDSDTLERLKDEQLLNFALPNEESEKYEEELEVEDEWFKLKSVVNSPTQTGKRGRGRPRKSAPKLDLKSENEPFEEDEDAPLNSDSDSDSDSVSSEAVFSASARLPRKESKKKIKRANGYIPPLELTTNEFGGKEMIFLSHEQWDQFLKDQKSKIKRKNRRYKTIMTNAEIIGNGTQNIPSSSTFSVSKRGASETKAIKVLLNNITQEFVEDSLLIDGRLAIHNTGLSSIFSVCFCKCSSCARNASVVTIFVASSTAILVISVEVSNQVGIKSSANEICRIVPPKKESIKSVCEHESFLSFSTNRDVYFLNCSDIHRQDIYNIISVSESNHSPLLTDISCHSWRGKYIAVGTLAGRVHVFNPTTMKEILQTSVQPNSAIYSLAWSDDNTIFIGGNFSKIFSIDLRDPFIVETEVSTLATLPKVVWSQTLNSVLFSDGENHARRFEKSNNSSNSSNRSHQPIGTFSSMVHDMDTSPLHNIIATACSSGSIQLSWLPEDGISGAVELEKRIFSLQKSLETEAFEIILDPEYVQFQVQDTIKLYPTIQACTSVSWCPNEQFPGLLVGSYSNGLLILIASDRFFI